MEPAFTTIDARFWRMLSIRRQRQPLSGAGAAIQGGRWNSKGMAALYLSADHPTAVAEFHQDLVRPGTLAAYHVTSAAIVDLTDPATIARYGAPETLWFGEWRRIVAIDKAVPASWHLAEALLGVGADGVLVPSARQPGGVNLVLWRWSETAGDGAGVTLIDPNGDLASPRLA